MRWVRGTEKSNLNQPTVIPAYNQGMEGVDLLDCTLSNLKPVI